MDFSRCPFPWEGNQPEWEYSSSGWEQFGIAQDLWDHRSRERGNREHPEQWLQDREFPHSHTSTKNQENREPPAHTGTESRPIPTPELTEDRIFRKIGISHPRAFPWMLLTLWEGHPGGSELIPAHPAARFRTIPSGISPITAALGCLISALFRPQIFLGGHSGGKSRLQPEC